MRREALAVLSMVLLASVAGAQEPVRENEMLEEPEEAQAERRPLRVLENPYDISSFYRSSEGGLFMVGPGYGYGSGYGDPANEKYPIAGYYRQRGAGYGYSAFWTNGYGGYPAYGGVNGGHRGQHRGGRGLGFRRSIGENGDLFLFAPAFLAPVGPLTGIFFSDPPK